MAEKDLKPKLIDPYENNPQFATDEEGKLYIRLPLSEKDKIRSIHPRDNTYQVVISAFWYKLCRMAEKLGIDNYNEIDSFIRLVNEFEIGGKVVTELRKKKTNQES